MASGAFDTKSFGACVPGRYHSVPMPRSWWIAHTQHDYRDSQVMLFKPSTHKKKDLPLL